MTKNMDFENECKLRLLDCGLADETDVWEYRHGVLTVWPTTNANPNLLYTRYWVEPEEDWEGDGYKICFHTEQTEGYRTGVGVCANF